MFRQLVLAVCFTCFASAAEPLRFEVKRVEKKTPGCVITFEYPEVLSAASLQARNRINAGLLHLLMRRTGFPGSDSGVHSLDEYATVFLGECRQFHEATEGKAPDRELYEHKLITILRYTAPILSFQCDASEDAGGAHPFGTTFFINFQSDTGKTLTMADLLEDGALPKLEAMAEAELRRDHRLSPTDKLSEQGYNFPDDRFRLNENFGVGERALLFLFNTYEIAAGAMGPTEIRIPLVQTRGLLKRDLPFW